MLNSYGQINDTFLNKSDYLDYVEKAYSIDTSAVYYITDSTTTRTIIFPSFTYFLNNEKIINVDEISQELQMNCPPKTLFKKLSRETVLTLFEEKSSNHGLIFKNLQSNETLIQNKDIIAVFLFSYRLKKTGTRYLQHIEMIEKMGFKTLILSMDMPYVESVTDYSKSNQLHFKMN